MVLTKGYGTPIPTNIENEILRRVMILLVTMNLDESLATHSYLQPLDGHENIYRLDKDGHNSRSFTYYIGKYGTCPAAISDVLPRFEVYDTTDSSSTVLMMADQCFPNLGAIISVGVACGIRQEVKICDVLVSSEVANCEAFKNDENLHSSSTDIMKVSPQLSRLFAHPAQWPSDLIKKRLNDNGEESPNVKSGLILSAHYLDDLVMENILENKFAHEVIGIEKEGINLFKGGQQTVVNSIIVKAVSDYGDGMDDERYRPTAALLAADFVDKCLNDPQAYEILKGWIQIIYHICS